MTDGEAVAVTMSVGVIDAIVAETPAVAASLTSLCLLEWG